MLVYAELAVRYGRFEDLEAFVGEAGLEVVSIPRAALFLAGNVSPDIVNREDRAPAFCPTSSLARKKPLLAN